MSKQDFDQLDKIFGAPVIFSYDEETLKTKKTLLIISIIGIVASFFGVSISTDSSLFGVKFYNLSQSLLVGAILVLNVFFWIKFIWMSFEYFLEWRLRVTGSGKSAVPKGGVLGSDLIDYATEPKQSTLYNWWLKHAKYFRESSSDPYEAINQIKEILKTDGWSSSSGMLVELIKKTETHLNNIDKVFGDGRLEYSLKRFDRAFFYLLKSKIGDG